MNTTSDTNRRDVLAGTAAAGVALAGWPAAAGPNIGPPIELVGVVSKLVRALLADRTQGPRSGNAYFVIDCGSGYVQALAPWGSSTILLELRPEPARHDQAVLTRLGFNPAHDQDPNPCQELPIGRQADLDHAAYLTALALSVCAEPAAVMAASVTLVVPGRRQRQCSLWAV